MVFPNFRNLGKPLVLRTSGFPQIGVAKFTILKFSHADFGHFTC